MTHTSNLSSSEFNTLFASLRDLDKCLVTEGCHKHDRVQVLINACIAGGVNTGTKIVGVLVILGFDRKHVGIVIKAGTQRAPEWPNWGRGADGTYYVPAEPVTNR